MWLCGKQRSPETRVEGIQVPDHSEFHRPAGPTFEKQLWQGLSARRPYWCSGVSLTAVPCPSIEGQLSEHVLWRLVSGSLNEYGAQVLLSCSPGYFLQGQRLLQCQANGTWNTEEDRPRCKGEWRQTLPQTEGHNSRSRHRWLHLWGRHYNPAD